MTKRYRNLSFMAGILAGLCYLIMAILAYNHYPLPYSPTTNWLSDLGNPVTNPEGAIFYNIGIVLTAVLLMLFFLGLSVWKLENNKVQVIMLRLTQVFGILGAFCMLMSGIFPINLYNIHASWSTSLYILQSTSFVFSVVMLRYHPKVPLWIMILGVSTAVMVLLTSFLQTFYLLEWITVLLFLCYVVILGILTKSIRRNL